MIVVLGTDAGRSRPRSPWRGERRVREPRPGARAWRARSSVGLGGPRTDGRRRPSSPSATSRVSRPTRSGRCSRRPIRAPGRVPRYDDDRGRNPVLLRRAAFALGAEATGDRGLGPVLAAHPELVREVAGRGDNPDVDTAADLAALAEAAWGDACPGQPRAGRLGSARSPTARTSTPRSARCSAPTRPGPTIRCWRRCSRSPAGRHAGSTSAPVPAASPCRSPGARAVRWLGHRARRVGVDARGARARSPRSTRIANVRTVEARWPPSDEAAGSTVLRVRGRRAHRPRRLRHRGDRAVPRRDGGGRTAVCRGGADGPDAGLGRRPVLAARPRRGTRPAAGAARVRRAAARPRPRPVDRARHGRARAASTRATRWRGSSDASSGSTPPGQRRLASRRRSVTRRAGRDGWTIRGRGPSTSASCAGRRRERRTRAGRSADHHARTRAEWRAWLEPHEPDRGVPDVLRSATGKPGSTTASGRGSAVLRLDGFEGRHARRGAGAPVVLAAVAAAAGLESNKERVERLEAAGLMRAAGRAAIEEAKRRGPGRCSTTSRT